MSCAERPRIECLGVAMDALTLAETVALIDRRVAARMFTQHVVVNVAKLVHMQDDAALRAAVEACDIVNIDGMGVVWGARLLGQPVPERVAGIDLFEALVALAEARGYPVFLLGATAEVVAIAEHRLEVRYPSLRIAGAHHGYFWDDEAAMAERIAASGARLLFVAITSPLKEVFIDRWRHRLGVDFVMGVGGTFDIVAGHVRRAPPWMQRTGLEWFHRVLQEPRRMWRRYLTTNMRFAGQLLAASVRRLSRRIQ
jgi:N-acetylglucosaminyldiphosphoundecaprenol N-acetyl-beta-D-mannosaminyltransferase